MKSRKKLEEVVASLRYLESRSDLHESIKKIREDIEEFLQETEKDPHRIKCYHGNVEWGSWD